MFYMRREKTRGLTVSCTHMAKSVYTIDHGVWKDPEAWAVALSVVQVAKDARLEL